MQFIPLLTGLGGGYLAWKSLPKDQPINRPLVYGDLSRCAGDPVRFHTNAEYMPLEPCLKPPTYKVVLVRLDPKFKKNGEDVQVGLCDGHLEQAELEHAKRMQDEPRAWQSYIFPLKRPTKRIYTHAKMP